MEKHNLLNEFPELKEKIQDLKNKNNYFKELYEKYDELEHEVYKINTGEEVVIDEQAHLLKAHLLHLKDQMFEIIKAE